MKVLSGPKIGSFQFPDVELPGELGLQVAEFIERHTLWSRARQYCKSTGKPLLRVGMRRSFLEPPNGDVTLDIDPAVARISGGVIGDERNMPFADKQFGCCFNEHTLEHLHNAADVEKAVNECVRVADMTILITPSPNSLYSNLFCPTHNLRLWLEDNKIKVAFNNYRTGFGFLIGPREQIVQSPGTMRLSHLITYDKAPTVVEIVDSTAESDSMLPMRPLDGPPLPRFLNIHW